MPWGKLLVERVAQVDPVVLAVLVDVPQTKVLALNNTKRLANLVQRGGEGRRGELNACCSSLYRGAFAATYQHS